MLQPPQDANGYSHEPPAQHTMRRASLADAPRVNFLVTKNTGDVLDFSQFLAGDLNVCLLCEEGGALFVWRGPGIYEVHVFFAQRGREVLDISRTMLDIMRKEFGAWLFWAAVPTAPQYRHVHLFTRLMGWTPQGLVDQPQGECMIYMQGAEKCRLS